MAAGGPTAADQAAADRVEVVVIGGGPAGATAALTLANAGRRVLLVGGEGGRAASVGEALPPAARPLLRDLGLLPLVEGDGHLPCLGNVSAWGSGELVVHDFLRDPHGPGWHLDRQRYDRALRNAAAEAGARIEPETHGAGVERDGEGWAVRLRSGGPGHGAPAERTVHASWLVDATGRASAVARWVGARRRRADRLVAFVARFRPQAGAGGDRDDRTWIEAVEDGWWYSARIPPGERVVAFHTDAALADLAVLRSADGFAGRLGRAPHLGPLLAGRGYRIVGRPRGVDASSAILDRVAGAGWLAVGDAAASFDPLSSQGLLNAHYTGLRGGQAILRSLAGDPTAVPGYAARIDRIYRAFLAHRTTYYGAEGRWRTRPFWSQRAA